MNESDPRSNVHYLGSSENKAWKIQACTGFEPMTSAIPVQLRIKTWMKVILAVMCTTFLRSLRSRKPSGLYRVNSFRLYVSREESS